MSKLFFGVVRNTETGCNIVSFGTQLGIDADQLPGDDITDADYSKIRNVATVLRDDGSLTEDYLIHTKLDQAIIINLCTAVGLVQSRIINQCGWA